MMNIREQRMRENKGDIKILVSPHAGQKQTGWMDSIDKIINSYFATMTNEAFIYKNKEFVPQPLRISPLLLRDYTCPVNCGACCRAFSLDWLPEEEHRIESAKERYIDFDGRRVLVYSDLQEDQLDKQRCKFLNLENGRCGIYEQRPFSCDFELIRFIKTQDELRENQLTQRLFGRGWAMTRVTGVKGAMCEMIEVSDYSIDEVERKMIRLKQWTDHFGLDNTKIPIVQEWVERSRKLVDEKVEVKPLHITARGEIEIR